MADYWLAQMNVARARPTSACGGSRRAGSPPWPKARSASSTSAATGPPPTPSRSRLPSPPPAAPGLPLRAEESAHVGGLPDVLEAVVGDADEAHPQRDRRIPPTVDDALEVGGNEVLQHGAAARRDGIEVLQQRR